MRGISGPSRSGGRLAGDGSHRGRLLRLRRILRAARDELPEERVAVHQLLRVGDVDSELHALKHLWVEVARRGDREVGAQPPAGGDHPLLHRRPQDIGDRVFP